MNKFLLYPVTARCLPMIRFVPWKSDDFMLCSFEGSSLTGSTIGKAYEYDFLDNIVYQGIKIYFDLPLLLQSCGELLKSFSLDLPTLEENYCGNHKTYINGADSELENIFQKLWRLSEKPSAFHLQIYTLELLHRLLNMEIRPPKTCGFYTETQVEIAKRAAQLLSDDLRQHIPVRQIAERFSVSETSLKNYFRGVYGQNISTWLREIRMNEAARLLSDTKRPIAEISEQVGYSNQGKFAAVFKKQFGLSPLEYRRSKNLENR